MRSPQPQQIPVITSDYIMNLHTMLEKLTEKVDQIGVTLESRTVPAVAPIPPAPAKLEVSLSFLAAATKTGSAFWNSALFATPQPQRRSRWHN